MKNENDRINLLYVNYSMAMGGIEQMIMEFVKYLPAEKFRSHVAVFEGGGILEKQLEALGVKVYDLEKKSGLDFSLVKKLARLIRELNIDVVHTNDYSPWLYSVLASKLGKKVNTVHTEHSNVQGHKKRRFLAENVLTWMTRHVVSVSEDVKKTMVTKGHMLPSRIVVVQNGIDTHRFDKNPNLRNRIRQELGIDSSDYVLGTVGRLVPVKDHTTLIMSFKQALDSIGSAKLIVVGSGIREDELKELINQQNITQNVYMVGESHESEAYLAAMDTYVVSSLSEGMSLSVLEAMSACLPVIATNVGGNPELVKHNVNGVLVEVQNVAEMAEQMIALSKNPELRNRLGQSGRERVEKDFSQEKMMQQYMDLYTS